MVAVTLEVVRYGHQRKFIMFAFSPMPSVVKFKLTKLPPDDVLYSLYLHPEAIHEASFEGS